MLLYPEAELELSSSSSSSSSSLLVVSQTGFLRTTADFVAFFFSLSLSLELLSDEDEDEEDELEKARVRVLRFLFGFTNGVVVVIAAVGGRWGLLLVAMVAVDGPRDVLFRYVLVGLIAANEDEIGTGGGGGSA